MKKQLKNIANIQTGVFAKPVSVGEVVYLQAKHFDEYGELKAILHPDLKADTISEKHLLKHGDVLFAAKGTKNFAAWYEHKNQAAVASTSFFVIRINDTFKKLILPEFLVWFINNPQTQSLLKGKAMGSSIASISKPVLEELEILLPTIEKQSLILKIQNLQEKEKELKRKTDILKEQLIQQRLIKAINE